MSTIIAYNKKLAKPLLKVNNGYPLVFTQTEYLLLVHRQTPIDK
jgi:hypothetical protein